MNSFDKFRRFGNLNYNSQDVLKNKIFNSHPVIYTDNMDYLQQVDHYESDYVWLIKKGIKISENFPWYYKPKETDSVHVFPYVYKGNRKIYSWNYAKLVPTKHRSDNVIKQKIIAGQYDAWQGKDSFDIFFLGNTNTHAYDTIKDKYNVKVVENFDQAKEQTTTDMFWLIPDDIEVHKSFNLTKYIPDEWSMEYTHVFGNDKLDEFDGIALFPKDYNPSAKELQYRFYLNKKEIKITASKRSTYDIFEIDSYEDYLAALKNTTTDLFWVKFPHAEVDIDFKFNLTFKTTNDYDRNTNHVFQHLVDGKITYDGVWLLSKNVLVSKNEIEHKHLVERKEWDQKASGPRWYAKYYIDTYEEYLEALESCQTEMFWGISRNVKVEDDFYFNTYFDNRSDEYVYERNENHAFIHRVDNKDYYNGIFLFSKNNPVSKKEIETRHLVSKKEWDIVASGPCKYDIFEINNYEEYLDALKNSKTELFWATNWSIRYTPDWNFDVYFTHDNEHDRHINHAFQNFSNGKLNYNGLFLLSKHSIVTQNEINHRYLMHAKQWEIIGSQSIQYDKFYINSWNEYRYALENSKTEMFWGLSRNIEIKEDFDWEIFFDPRDNTYDYERNENHAFIHRVKDKDYYNGLFLFSKNKEVSQNEIETRHLVSKKEWDIVASGPCKYDIFEVDDFPNYEQALLNSKTEMFWITSKNIDTSDFDFDLHFTHDDHYNRFTNHAFVHEVNGKKMYNGVFLCSQHTSLTKNEIETRHLVEKKEWDIVASRPKRYDIFTVDTYEDYLTALNDSSTELFWAVSSNVDTSEFSFDVYFTHDNYYDRYTNHVFQHNVDGDNYFNGVFLLTTNVKLPNE